MIGVALVGTTRFLVGGRALWRGCEPAERQRIYFANHGSHLDTVLIWAALPRALRARTHPVAAADYWGGDGPKGWFARRVLGAVLVERRGGGAEGKGQPSALDPLRRALRQGRSLILFPEGTRGGERLPGPFKPGLYRLAREFPGAELIPVFLENPARALPKGELIPVPVACTVHFGGALRLSDGEGADAFLERARAAVSGMAP